MKATRILAFILNMLGSGIAFLFISIVSFFMVTTAVYGLPDPVAILAGIFGFGIFMAHFTLIIMDIVHFGKVINNAKNKFTKYTVMLGAFNILSYVALGIFYIAGLAYDTHRSGSPVWIETFGFVTVGISVPLCVTAIILAIISGKKARKSITNA